MEKVACIYNPNHLVKPSRKQIHEMKCPDRFKKQNEFKYVLTTQIIILKKNYMKNIF